MFSLRNFVLACLALTAPAAAATCDDLAKLALPNTTIQAAQPQLAGSFTPPEGKAFENMPAFCRVVGVLAPSKDSNIQFEVWLPASGWNQKFQGVGNGGFAGTINFSQLADALKHGYATASTDTGHHSREGIDGSWALGHPEKIADFGYRAMHETAVTAKAIIHAYYGSAPQHSYFNSCSNGGRQALMEAQRYPADYDGIVAGAPANYWTHLLAGGSYVEHALLADSASYISTKKLPAIEAAALEACDTIDGLKDGLIDDPRQCHFVPEAMLCKGPETDACLTEPQIVTLKKIYAGPHDSKGHPIFPGYAMGAESGMAGWGVWITGLSPGKSALAGFGTAFFQDFVYDDPNWSLTKFEAERDTKAADSKMASYLNATDPDLKAFQQRGGKLLMYHGWDDPAIPAENSIHYYESVVSKMGAGTAASFLKLYMAPGVQHCLGGPGPDSFGQLSVDSGDADHDIDTAVKRWVEQGIAPGPIVAVKYKINFNPKSGIVRSRPLCPYPQVEHYKGSGSIDDAANFTCATK
jgi:feruloyl esterase